MKTNTKKRTGIRSKQKFYSWLVLLGGDVANFDPEGINFDIPILASSFKKRAQEIKEKHNYKFSDYADLFLTNYPNIEKLTFVTKSA